MVKFTPPTGRPPRIPRKLRIGPYEVRVRIVKSSTINDNCGEFDISRLIISVSREMTPAMRYSTFLHEVIEAINYIYELKLPHNKIQTLEAALQGLEVLT